MSDLRQKIHIKNYSYVTREYINKIFKIPLSLNLYISWDKVLFQSAVYFV